MCVEYYQPLIQTCMAARRKNSRRREWYSCRSVQLPGASSKPSTEDDHNMVAHYVSEKFRTERTAAKTDITWEKMCTGSYFRFTYRWVGYRLTGSGAMPFCKENPDVSAFSDDDLKQAHTKLCHVSASEQEIKLPNTCPYPEQDISTPRHPTLILEYPF